MREIGVTAPRQFHPELESLRGLAALSVAGFHISQSPAQVGDRSVMLREMPSVAMDVLNILFQGLPSVVFFFVLSGFVLTASLQRTSRPVTELAVPFAVARLFRIYPAWIFAVLVFAGVYWLTGKTLGAVPMFAEVVRNILLLSVSIDGVGWSIQTELLAIPVLLVALHWIAAGKVVRIFVIGAVLAVLTNPMKVILPLEGGEPRAMYLYLFPVRRADACAFAARRSPSCQRDIRLWRSDVLCRCHCVRKAHQCPGCVGDDCLVFDDRGWRLGIARMAHDFSRQCVAQISRQGVLQLLSAASPDVDDFLADAAGHRLSAASRMAAVACDADDVACLGHDRLAACGDLLSVR